MKQLLTKGTAKITQVNKTMQELNLKVGQKVWSIQLGYCHVNDKSANLIYLSNGKRALAYLINGKESAQDEYQSVFETNPFDQSVKANEMVDNEFRQFHFMPLETVSQPENKAELVDVLLNGFSKHLVDKYNNHDDRITKINDLVYEKLKKLLESL